MSCCFATASDAVQAQAADPTRHVNYVRGLVLDVDDFTQEFAYLAGRDQWLVRDMLGYGTLRGLQVTLADSGGLPDDELKWKVSVGRGTAADPCGRLVCVGGDQCGYVNKWLAQNGDAVAAWLNLNGGSHLALHLVLSYADFLTQTVPIPGEPCRSEDALKAPSRISDDFVLDFSLDAPKQIEEDALRNFAQWLRAIPVADGQASTKTPAEFATLVAAWQAGDTAPPADLTLAPADLAAYRRDALRIWATLLRPRVYGRSCGCATLTDEHEPRLLLATLQFDVEQPIGKAWRVKGTASVDESRRPVLVHSRLLAERPAAERGAAPAIMPAAIAGPQVRLVAAGKLKGDGTADGPVFGSLAVQAIGAGSITFGFDGYSPPAGQHQYIVKVLAVSTAADPAPVVRFLEFGPAGFVLRVNPGAKANTPKTDIAAHEFMLEVDEIRQAA